MNKKVDVRIYEDEICWHEIDNIDFDIVSAGEKKSVTVYLKNEGTLPLINIKINVTGNYVTIDHGVINNMRPKGIIPITLTFAPPLEVEVGIGNAKIIVEGYYLL